MGELRQEFNPHIRGIVWVRGETFKSERETADLWQPKWNENQTVLAAATRTPDRDAGALEGTAAGSWSLGIVEQSQGKGCCWLWRDGSRGCEGGDGGGRCLWWEMPVEGGWAATEVRRECWVTHRGGAISIASLSPHASISGWIVERLAHQMPEALNYRVGAHPGGPLYVPDTPNNREGPQAREPSKCLNGQLQKKTGQRGLLITSYKRLEKRLWWGHNSCDGGSPYPARLVPPGSPQAKQLCHLHARLSQGQSCHRQKMSCIYALRVTSVVSNSLQPCRLWPTSFSVREGASSGKNTGAYWPILVAIPF